MKQKTIKLLLVDDDEDDRLQILCFLERASVNCEVHEASTMQSALEQMMQTRYDCVLLDYHIPDQNGLQGVRKLLEANPFLPVVMLTGRGDETIACSAIKLGARDYASKAKLTPVGLKRMVLNAIERAEIDRIVDEQQHALAVFAQVLVHDMKTPTQSILGFARIAEFLLDQKPVDLEKIKGQTQRITAGAERMAVMLDQLHAFNEADIKPRYENISLCQILKDVTDNLDVVIRQEDVKIIFDELPTIYADRMQLTQLLQNLISNGIKYCKSEQPEIRIETQSFANGEYVIEVRDNGIGIDEEHFGKIFEPFKRLHSRGEFEGTGLGLATCKRIVERHKGRIWCESHKGEGTSFFFSLPMVEQERLPVTRSA